jgi:transcriptional regulator with XRE-family HTH domain
MSRKLQNYLLTYRKRYGLTQDETAFLLGVKSGAKVSRYETFQREPNLKTALALQALFGVPVAELFAGIYEQVEKDTSERARILQDKMEGDAANKANARKAELLRAIAITPDINNENP